MIKRKYYKEYHETKIKFDKEKKNCFSCNHYNNCDLIKTLHEFDETHEYNDETEKERIEIIEKYKSPNCIYGIFVEERLKNGKLFGIRENSEKCVKTNLTAIDVPRRYFKSDARYIDMSGITDVKYKWHKENHYMKDSMLYMKRNGEFVTLNAEFEYDSVLWGYDIFKALKYIKKYSPNIDITPIISQMKEQIEWLKENERDTWMICVEEGAKKDFEHWFLTEVDEPN